MSERRRRTLRSFYCEEGLWAALDERAAASDISLDDALNQALRAWLQGGVQPAAAQISAQVPVDAKTMAMSPLSRPPSPPVGRAPMPTPPPPPVAPPAPAARRQELYVQFEGQTYHVDKDEFIIGRGTQGTDLTIRDGNVSRKHAAVVRENGVFHIRDLGSTNGVIFDGERVASRPVQHGDVYFICDHELSFAYA